MRGFDAIRRAIGGTEPEVTAPEVAPIAPIGVVRSGLRDLRYRDATRQKATLVILPKYGAALKDIDGFSHLIVLTWLHRVLDSERALTVRMDADDGTSTRGSLALRTHHRPNPIGMTVVRLLRREGDALEVVGLDVVDGTPILDIKPYLPSFDSVPEATLPAWARGEES